MIAVVALTHNRVHLLRRCVENVLGRTSELTTEIVIWDNASTDGTAEYLHALDDPRIRVVRHPENIGQNAYAPAFALTAAPYMVELDDDMIDAPVEWDRALLDAFEKLPAIGFLAANLVDNPNDQAARVMYHERPNLYTSEVVEGVRLLRGPVGGGCAITSRELHDRVGGFRQRKDRVFWLEDEAYIADIAKLGFGAAYLEDLKLLHAGGSYYAAESAEKDDYWRRYWLRELRKNTVKRILLRLPLVRPLNDRYRWFRLAEIPDAVSKAL
jgi:GT2 family glycosyltransferase